MNLPAWLGLENYNAWEVHWGTADIVWALLVLGVVLPFTLWFFWFSLARISSTLKKSILFGLRVTVLILLVMVVLQPRLELKHILPMRNAVAVVLDDSRSLEVKTFPSSKTRLDLVKETLEASGEFFDTLKETHQVDFYFASDKLDSVSRAESLSRYRPRGVNTDFANVFTELETRYEGKSLQGVILMSDGADLVQAEGDVSPELTELVGRMEGPVYTYLAGNQDGFKDLGIQSLEVSDFGFVHQPIRLTATVTANNLGTRTIPVVLKEGDKIHASQSLSIKPGQERYTVELNFTPGTTGKRFYSVSLPLFSGEAVEANNQTHFQVNVVRDRIRILHLNGRPSWDSRFLREVLVNNPKVDLLSFFILRTLSDDVMASTSELSLIPFPSNLLFTDYLDSFDLVVFHNFRFKPFIDKKYLANIKKFVEEGGAFLMIGGDLSFQSGEYMRTPVEEILPVKMDRNAKWFSAEEFQAQVEPDHALHPILSLEKDDAQNQEIWRSMPSLSGWNSGLIPVKGAQVLAGRKGAGKKDVPILVTRQFGEGRSMAIATDTLWNWNFLRVGQGGSGRYYQKFWENVISWMTRDPQTHPLHIESSKERYWEEEKVGINFRALGLDYNPLPETPVTMTIRSLPDKTEQLKQEIASDDQGEGRLEFEPQTEGFYSAEISLETPDGLFKKETRFSVFSPADEFEKPQVNPQLMQTLAKISGGAYTVLGEGARIEGLSFPNPDYEVKTSSRTFSLWDSWWSYGMILGLLATEWWIRRKSGLS